MTGFVRYWRGDIPLLKTFWMGWAIPIVGGYLLMSATGWWVINNIGLMIFYALILLLGAFTVIAVVPVWRSSKEYRGHWSLKYGARAVVLLAGITPLVVVAATIASVVAIKSGNDPTHDEKRTAEKTAVPTDHHPMAGFWKDNCADDFGLAIAPAGDNLYSLSFCGPGGCFKPGSYRPDSPIVGDSNYQVMNTDTLRVRGRDGWSTYKRYSGRTSGCQP